MHQAVAVAIASGFLRQKALQILCRSIFSPFALFCGFAFVLFGRAPKYRTKGCSRYWRPKFTAMKWLNCCKNQCSRSRAVSEWAVWTPFCVILWSWLTLLRLFTLFCAHLPVSASDRVESDRVRELLSIFWLTFSSMNRVQTNKRFQASSSGAQTSFCRKSTPRRPSQTASATRTKFCTSSGANPAATASEEIRNS